MSPTVTVFIPAFNEVDNLAASVEILLAKMDELGVNAEILIVDDGSQDGTAQRADEPACQLERVRSTHHASNLGIGMSFRTAVELARGEWMIFIPADLALHPDELGRYFEAAPQADIVVGLRSDRSDYTWLRHLVSWTNIHLIQALFGMQLRQFQYTQHVPTGCATTDSISNTGAAHFSCQRS
jgi:glycosyltransferase involved in cell wall biosynthesis